MKRRPARSARGSATCQRRADREELQRVIDLVADWPTPMRQVFTLRKVYECTAREIARALDLSDHEVEQCLIAAALACAAHGTFPDPPSAGPDSTES